MLGYVNQPVSGGFFTNPTTAPVNPFSGKDPFKAVNNTFVLAEQESDFAAAHSNITCRYIGFRPHMTIQLSHKTLAKAHNFIVRFSFGVEI